jgi:IstB-like ATP binding protein
LGDTLPASSLKRLVRDAGMQVHAPVDPAANDRPTMDGEASDHRKPGKLQRDLEAVKLLIVDEFGYVLLSPTSTEILFEILSQRYERNAPPS